MNKHPVARKRFTFACCLLLTFMFFPLHSVRAEIIGAEENEPADEVEKTGEEAIKAEFPYSFNDVSKNLVIIECKTSLGGMAGSGFIVTVDGKTYIYTNQHVIMGADSIEFKTVTGEELKPSGVELSMQRDIARLPIEDRDDALVISDGVAMDIPLAVFGNSEGGGVATELYGKVTGVGSELLEVSAEFVSGNSGSPVLNMDREVIGIASYVRYSEASEMKEGTKFENKVRRFCYRLTNVKFAPVNWRIYNEKYGKPYLETQSTIDAVVAIIEGWGEEPFSRVPSEDLPDISLNRWSTKHNKMVERVSEIIRKQRASRSTLNKLRDEIHQSARDLSNISHRLALEMEDTSEDPALTGFLREEFESYAGGLEYISEVLDLAGQEIADYIDNL